MPIEVARTKEANGRIVTADCKRSRAGSSEDEDEEALLSTVKPNLNASDADTAKFRARARMGTDVREGIRLRGHTGRR
jgi:hypothetical protein